MQSFKSYFSFSETELSEVAKTKVVLLEKRFANHLTVTSMSISANGELPPGTDSSLAVNASTGSDMYWFLQNNAQEWGLSVGKG